MNVTMTVTTAVFHADKADPVMSIVILLVGTVVGALVSNYFSNRAEMQKRLLDQIYIPVLSQLGQIYDKIQKGESLDLSGLRTTMSHGTFLLFADKRVRQEADFLCHILELYNSALEAARGRVNTIVRQEIEKHARIYQLKKEQLARMQAGRYELTYTVHSDQEYMGSVSLNTCLLTGEKPDEILMMRIPAFSKCDVSCVLCGFSYDSSLCDIIVTSAMEEAKQDNDIRGVRDLRGFAFMLTQDFFQSLIETRVGRIRRAIRHLSMTLQRRSLHRIATQTRAT